MLISERQKLSSLLEYLTHRIQISRVQRLPHVKVSRMQGLRARLESLFSARGRYFSQSDLRAWKTNPASPPYMKWDTFKYIFQILRASLGIARKAACACVEDLQHALHTFQSGLRVCNVTWQSLTYCKNNNK